MRKLTAAEVTALQDKLQERIPDYNKYDFLLEGCEDVPGIEWIEREGGGEGGAEDCHTIFCVDGIYYQWDYSYYSYNGFDIYDDIYEVKPSQKTITVYR